MSTHTTTSREKRWYEQITIDLIALILQRSIFHPFIAWLIPLCQRAVGAPYESFEFRATCSYAAFITLVWMLSVINKRLAYGVPRELDWDEEVVVVTGGASGLGKIMAEMYGMRGASVAVLDVHKPAKESEGLAGVHFYQCDVGDAAAVEKAKTEIEKDLGPPTILLNNAGIVNGKPILSLRPSEIQRNFNVNLLSHFNTIRTFLPGMLASPIGGTIVTVASVLGKLGASHLSDYSAAKAGLIAMHTSLRAELSSSNTAPAGAENIRTILVTPGQLSTSLFAGLETPSSFLGPVVEPVELAREIVRMVDAGESGHISMPLYARCIDWLHILPVGLQRFVRACSGVDRAMEDLRASKETLSAAKRANNSTAEEKN
ncbi:hypothetical protein LTR85_011414 [Meristemomyces frigidus]|nr:hypothetical protein LTR85_011414 [Meristemomyces frigidus]